jgi:hypothetical protein
MTHALVNGQETRKLREIVEIINVGQDGVAITNTPFVWNATENVFYYKRESKIFDKISKRFGVTQQELHLEFARRTRLLFEMQKRKTFGYEEIQKLINEYYKNPKSVLSKFGIQ